MISKREFRIDEGGIRLDAALLREFPSTTRAFAREAVERGCVFVDGRTAAKGLKLRGGETILVRELLEADDNAFDKPAGMPVQPLSCRESGTLMNLVCARFPECASVGDEPLMAGALHRIDADTSGLVLVARTQNAFENMRAQFAAQTVRKTYLALVEGSVAVGGRLENDLAHDPTLPFCRMIDARRNRLTNAQRARLRPLHAVTEFRPIAMTTCGNEDRTLLEVTIYTGVTHQIRAQLALAGLHIVNDRLYGAFAVENQRGHCLHALAAKFTHPESGDPVEIQTPYPSWASFR